MDNKIEHDNKKEYDYKKEADYFFNKAEKYLIALSKIKHEYLFLLQMIVMGGYQEQNVKEYLLEKVKNFDYYSNFEEFVGTSKFFYDESYPR